MKSCEVYRCRRIALRLSREEIADRAGIQADYVRFFEDGKNIRSDFVDKIKKVIDDAFRELDEIEHYKTRILELAYEIRFDSDTKQTLSRTSHMIVELGKLQRSIINY